MGSELEGELTIQFEDGLVNTLYQLSRSDDIWILEMLVEDGMNSEYLKVTRNDSGVVETDYERNGGREPITRLPHILAECTEKMEEIPNLRPFCESLLEIASSYLEVSNQYLN